MKILKKYICLIITTLIFTSTFALTASADANKLSIREARLLILGIARGEDMSKYMDFDFDNNGRISLSDARTVVCMIANGAKNIYDKYTLYFETATFIVEADTPIAETVASIGKMESMTTICYKNFKIPSNQFKSSNYVFYRWGATRKSDGYIYCKNTYGKSGWFDKNDIPSGYQPYLFMNEQTIYIPAENGEEIVFSVQWKKGFTTSFNSNGGTGKMSDFSVAFDKDDVLPQNTFTKKGYIFNGWYANRASDNSWYYTNNQGHYGWYSEHDQPIGYEKYLLTDKASVSNLTDTQSDEVTLYADWADVYTINYNLNGGRGTISTHEIRVGENVTLSHGDIKYDYKTFDCWYASRSSDNKWLYRNQNGTSGWFEKGTQPDGYVLYELEKHQTIPCMSNVAADVVTMHANWTSTFRKEVYGSSVQGRELYAYIFNDTRYANKTLFINFAIHGFEDEYFRDGQVLVNCALGVAKHYQLDCESLQDYRLVLIPCANPDGTYAGINDERATSKTAFGRCTAEHIDINRDFGNFKAQESVYLRNYIQKYNPNIYVDCHGWLDEVVGNKEVGSIFVDEFNLSITKYDKDLYKYGYVYSWVSKHITTKSVLLEFKNSQSADVEKMVNSIDKIVDTVK